MDFLHNFKYEMNNELLLPPFQRLGKLFNINHPCSESPYLKKHPKKVDESGYFYNE